MGPVHRVGRWPLYRQLTGTDRRGLGAAARSGRTAPPRTAAADAVVKSVCPYCAVGCGQNVYVADDRGVPGDGSPQEESHPDRGRPGLPGQPRPAVPEGIGQFAADYGRLAGVPGEVPASVRDDMGRPGPGYGDGHDRGPGNLAARRAGWQQEVGGNRTRRTLGFASLGGATLDNEENYLIKKLFTALGAIQIENQARI